MSAAEFQNAEEDNITDELVEQINDFRTSPDAPDWVDRYEVHEQRRTRNGLSRGKSRPIFDIEIERACRGPRPRLAFEAKRLGRNHSVGKYLGDEGMGAFISGHYSTTHGEAGVIGYVQVPIIDDWRTSVATELKKNHVKHSAIVSEGMVESVVHDDCVSHHTAHTCANGTKLLVVHIFLQFTSI
jgi:hypothetical protein